MDAEENFLYSMLIINLFYLSYLYFGFCIIFEKIIIKGSSAPDLESFLLFDHWYVVGHFVFCSNKEVLLPQISYTKCLAKRFSFCLGKDLYRKGFRPQMRVSMSFKFIYTHIYTPCHLKNFTLLSLQTYRQEINGSGWRINQAHL